MTDNGDKVPCVSELSCRERHQTMREVIERRIDAERALVDMQFDQRDKALTQQAIEYARRLDDLNHNLRMMLDDRKMFYTRDQHDTFAQEYRVFRDHANGAITEIQTRAVVWTSALGLAIIVINIVLHLIWK